MHGEANDWTSAEALRISLTTDALLNDKGGFALVIRNSTGEPASNCSGTSIALWNAGA